MRFYDMLQLDPTVLKPKIKAAETAQQRRRIQSAMVLRSFLIVAFAIAFIAPLSAIFGSENTPMAVVIFCALLGIRFVDFGYCITDSLRNLAIVFLLLFAAPVMASHLHPLLGFFIDCGAFFTILLMCCDKPEMGNGGIYSFAYVFLSGNPVEGELLFSRFLLTLLGFLLCGGILFMKHRHKNTEVRFLHIASKFDWLREESRWQVRMALGTSCMLCLGRFIGLERFMWAGFACASLLCSYPTTVDVKERFRDRIVGVLTGSLLFAVIYSLVPTSMRTLLGPIGGFCLGFCTQYRYKTVMNCFGALMLAAGLYGIEGAVLLRVFDNIVGVVFGYGFLFLFQYLVEKTTPEAQASNS